MAVEMLPAVPADNGSLVTTHKKNRIQVSNTKKPLFFYVNLAKKYIQQHNEVELSALGMEVLTSSIGMKDESRGRTIQKAKIEIVLEKSESEAKPKAKDQQGKVDAEDKKKDEE